MAATMKDIAKETGLGLATISSYLNGGNVREKNRVKIEQAIEKLNFEVNAVVYDEREAEKMAAAFRRDLEVCTRITKELYVTRSLMVRFKEQVCRLLSPLL